MGTSERRTRLAAGETILAETLRPGSSERVRNLLNQEYCLKLDNTAPLRKELNPWRLHGGNDRYYTLG